MNYQEIVNKLEELELYPGDIAYITESWKGVEPNLQTFKDFVGEIVLLHEEGDYEGGGDHAEKVFYFKEHDVYLRIMGFYASHYGTEWDADFQQVFPRRQMITVFETPEEMEKNLEDEKNDVSGN